MAEVFFNPGRLALARKRRRLTARALALGAGLSPETISRLEKGINEPDESTVASLAQYLRYPIEFMYGNDPADIDTRAVSFRSFSKMSAKERDAAISAGSLGLHLNEWVESRFTLPAVNVPDLGYEHRPADAAYSLRQHWGLGERPVNDMIGLIETNGIRVFSLSENTASVNAFSFWRDGQPFVFLNMFKSAESSVFDTAHELGHLVMHRHGDPKESRILEREANEFAAAFLMPERDVRSHLPSFITIDFILTAKARWRVSAMALVHRLRSLFALTDWQYKSFCIELSRRGFRSSEKDGIEREGSKVWKKILEQLWLEKTTKQHIADDLAVPLDELEGLIWELVGRSRHQAVEERRLSLVS